MKRPAAPPLEFPYPPCSICGQECQLDGSWYCPVCNVTWPMEGAATYDGEWDEPKAEQCTSVMRPWDTMDGYPDLKDVEYRCYLEAGHIDDEFGSNLHYHPQWYDGWKDRDEHVYEVES